MYKMENKAIQPFFPFETWGAVTTVTMIPNTIDTRARNMNMSPLARAKSLPTELFFSQCGHRASWLTNELNRNVSPQWPQLTRHIPGMGEMSLALGVFFAVGEYKTIILWQDWRGHEILCAVDLHMSKQLQGHLIYFCPGGGFLIGYDWIWVWIIQYGWSNCFQVSYSRDLFEINQRYTYSSFITVFAFDNMLVLFVANIYHWTTNATCYNWRWFFITWIETGAHVGKKNSFWSRRRIDFLFTKRYPPNNCNPANMVNSFH